MKLYLHLLPFQQYILNNLFHLPKLNHLVLHNNHFYLHLLQQNLFHHYYCCCHCYFLHYQLYNLSNLVHLSNKFHPVLNNLHLFQQHHHFQLEFQFYHRLKQHISHTLLDLTKLNHLVLDNNRLQQWLKYHLYFQLYNPSNPVHLPIRSSFNS